MPHFTLEYSPNIEAYVNMNDICDKLRVIALETGIFPIGGTRIRAFRAHHVSIADGNPQHGFLDVSVKIGVGRDIETRKKAGEHVYKALETLCSPCFENMTFALSLDIREMEAETSFKTNTIHKSLK